MFMKSCNCIIVTLRHRVPLRGFTRLLFFPWSCSTFILRWRQHSAEVLHIIIIIMIVHLPIFHWQTLELFVVICRYMLQSSDDDECCWVVTFVSGSLIMRKHVWLWMWGGGFVVTECDTTCSELRWCSWFICVVPQTVCMFNSKQLKFSSKVFIWIINNISIPTSKGTNSICTVKPYQYRLGK